MYNGTDGITIQEDGLYLISLLARVTIPTISSGKGLFTMSVNVNTLGATASSSLLATSASVADSPRFSITAPIYLTAGQVIRGTIYQNTGNPATLTSIDSGNNRLSVRKIQG